MNNKGGEMSKGRRSDLLFGILLILIGGWFLAAQFDLVPSLQDIMNIEYQWPLIVIGVGIFLFLLGLLLRNPSMSVPACIVGGIGGLLYWTNSTGNWGAWTYLWTLIPGFVGLGIILATLLGGHDKTGYKEGVKLILISGILLIIFLILFSGQGQFIKYWPVLLVLAGAWIIIQTIFRKK
jgi:hypothetical protein